VAAVAIEDFPKEVGKDKWHISLKPGLFQAGSIHADAVHGRRIGQENGLGECCPWQKPVARNAANASSPLRRKMKGTVVRVRRAVSRRFWRMGTG
jgi:hypothetical protein